MVNASDTITGAISIHTLRVEGDVPAISRAFTSKMISIHTLRVEGDVG